MGQGPRARGRVTDYGDSDSPLTLPLALGPWPLTRFIMSFGKFFLPGPTEVRPEILAAQTRPMIGHRGKSMEELVASLAPGLQNVFRTKRPVYISTSSATGMMEAAVRNGARRKVLSLVNGAFSERFHKIAVACGLDADVLEVPLGEGHSPDLVDHALRRADYDAVTVVHSETSTGVLNPIEELAKVTHARGDVALLVDSVTGIAGSQVETDAWELDFVLTGSQKALALPPGLAFGVARPSLLERAKAKKDRGIYFDFIEFEKNIVKHQTPNTPAVSLFYALAAQLDAICRETIEARWERHTDMARRTWEWADEMKGRGLDVRVLAPQGYRSATVTCLTVPAGQTGSAVTAALKKRGFTIASGYGALKDATIRIGHMGDHTVAELDVLLAELEQVLAS
jgi:aspartate aminotransferase-like enzyme